ncbi:MAG: cellulase family glycosylhydrolase, partial [Acidimicrobiales bacterium]|nr:cellulase family glycosylhydrolase [Acidimicrobiales bacterium]
MGDGSGQQGRVRAVVAIVAAVVGLVAAVPVVGAASGAPPAVAPAVSVGARAVVPAELELVAVQTSSDRRFVDLAGREVLLRGANLNSLGEYWQGVPGLDPTVAVTDADWDSMAAHGFSVVRLLVTWSRLEPTRGTIDEAYLDEVEAAVDAAAARGIYTVIDMHQDAYTAFLSTADPAACPPGTAPAKGWDGAPAWAVLDDGLSTCLTNGERNSSPAVNRAWNNFYDDVDGIRGRFVATWGAVAERFAGRPEVAGYDVLNEPENPRPAAELTPIYEAFLAEVIGAIRAAEAGASFDHVIFIEPALPAADPSRGLVIPDPARAGVSTENLSASVHNYAESIGDPLGAGIEGTNEIVDDLTAGLGVPNWGGEYGFWDTSAET